MSTSMITRCAHCGTAFRVYEHQLAKREGHVRCGACGEVFDAYDSLEAEREAAQEAAYEEASAPATNAEPPAPPPPQEPSPPESSPIESPVAEAEPEPSPSPSEPPPEPAPEPERAEPQEERSYVTEDGGDYDFGPPRPEKDRRPAYIGAIVVASFFLVLQTLVWFRSEISARFTPLRPPLEAMCRLAACTVTLPTVAEQIAIESSDLQSDGDYLVLVSVLRNKASFTQAFPAVELTLTDAREQPVARRILKPEDYLDPSVRPASGVGSGAEVLARVYIDASGLNATGYRMLVFYP